MPSDGGVALTAGVTGGLRRPARTALAALAGSAVLVCATSVRPSVLPAIGPAARTSVETSGPALESAAPEAAPLGTPTFRDDAWMLPDEPLLGFVEIPAGPFLMGSDPTVDPLAFENERWSAESVQGRVDLPTFYIGRYEVTVGQFREFVDDSGYANVAPEALNAPPDHPITGVSWTDALAYARWLESNLRESDETPPEISALLEQGWRVTLPTEAQWEKAARGPDGRIFPWGSQPRPDRANYSARGTAPVGSFDCPECPYELADMSGNVWEWTRSPMQPYPYDESDDRSNLEADALWVMRGGAFSDQAQNIRAAIRGGADPSVRRPFLGFRLAISPL